MVFNLGNKTSVIELGTFWDIVHQDNERIAFELEWLLAKEKEIKNIHYNQSFKGNLIKFSAEIGLPNKTFMVVHQMSYQLGELSKNGLKVQMKREDNDAHNYSLTAFPYDFLPTQSALLPHPIHFYGFKSPRNTKTPILFTIWLWLWKNAYKTFLEPYANRHSDIISTQAT